MLGAPVPPSVGRAVVVGDGWAVAPSVGVWVGAVGVGTAVGTSVAVTDSSGGVVTVGTGVAEGAGDVGVGA